MSHCCVYYPGLLGPDLPIEQLQKNEWPDNTSIANLALVLSRGRKIQTQEASVERSILQLMGYHFAVDEDEPMARLRAQQNGPVEHSQRLWCLDPVNIQIDKEAAILFAADELDLSEQDQKELIRDLNQHLNQDGFEIIWHADQQWLLRANLDLSTSSLLSAYKSFVHQHEPVGTDAQRWRTVLNEIQMLLFSHPVNEKRELQGKLPANSVWLWGGGLEFKQQRTVSEVFSDQDWVCDIAQHAGLRTINLSHASLEEVSRKQSLVVCTQQLENIRSNDVFAWINELLVFEREILTPLLALLKNTSITQLEIVSDRLSVSVQKKHLGFWWRSPKPLQVSMNKLRKQYGF